MGTHAIRCLEKSVFAALPHGSVDEVIESRKFYTKWALEGGDRGRNFYYREIEEGTESGAEDTPEPKKKVSRFYPHT